MSKISVPINLKSYEVVTENVTKKEVEDQLRDNISWLLAEQKDYYKNHATGVIDKIISEHTRITGSVNSMGRALGIAPTNKPSYQAWNLAEMFRAVVVSKIGLTIQQEAINRVIMDHPDENPSPESVRDILRAEHPTVPALPYQYVKKTVDRITKKGTLDPFPSPSGVLPFWATDMHYSKVSRDKRSIFFSFKVEGKGMVTLLFTLPNNPRFVNDHKVSRPTVFIRNGRLVFGFTIESPLPPLRKPVSAMGVDLGRRVPFVATIANKDGDYSQPILPNKQINRITNKITRLDQLGAIIYAKEILNKERGHEAKGLVLQVERERIRSKKSRLKKERAIRVARQITLIAQRYNALIVLEDLSWVPHSRWEQSIVQTTIVHAARKVGARTRHVSPRNTSQECNRCGQKVTHSARSAKCQACAKTLNRDILASRNIVKKAGTFLNKQLPLRTRVTVPVTTGFITNYVPLTARLVT